MEADWCWYKTEQPIITLTAIFALSLLHAHVSESTITTGQHVHNTDIDRIDIFAMSTFMI